MGSIGGMLGLGGGASGTGFDKSQMAAILPGTTGTRIDETYVGSRNALDQQQALLQALQGQGGIGNQSQVYGQLQGVANGTGPNPAQAMLAQSTGANVANQAALMAGQRGAGANVGLMARTAAQQGAGIQQNAAGQAATMQAQQSLNALGQAGQMANTQAGQQIGATTALSQAQQNQQKIAQDALAAQNAANVQSQSSVNSGNTALASKGMEGQQKLIGGIMNSASGGAAGMAGGGVVGMYANGGQPSGPQSQMGQYLARYAEGGFLSGWSGGAEPAAQPKQVEYENPVAPQQTEKKDKKSNSDKMQDAAKMAMMFAAEGGNVGSKLKGGGHVPGQAKAAGNSYSNDTVKALLSPGELVIDRETMKDKGKAGDAARFLAAVIEAKKRGKK